MGGGGGGGTCPGLPVYPQVVLAQCRAVPVSRCRSKWTSHSLCPVPAPL